MRFKDISEFKEDIEKCLRSAINSIETAEDVPVDRVMSFLELARIQVEDALDEVLTLTEITTTVLTDMNKEVASANERVEDLENQVSDLEHRLEFYEE